MIRDLLKQLLETLQYLHSIGVCHRDIKLENILLVKTSDETYHPKLIDFGLSAILLKGETLTSGCGTLAFSSPEILQGLPHDA
jgi:serine/threonine protein kinase